MIQDWNNGGGLLRGALRDASGTLPLLVRAVLTDLQPRFLPKCRVGRGYRAVARNGQVLLASAEPLADLVGREVLVRFQVWHRAILPGDAPKPYGILICINTASQSTSGPLHETRLTKAGGTIPALALDVGGGLFLEFKERHNC